MLFTFFRVFNLSRWSKGARGHVRQDACFVARVDRRDAFRVINFFYLFFDVGRLSFSLLRFHSVVVSACCLCRSFFEDVVERRGVRPRPVPFKRVQGFKVLRFLYYLICASFAAGAFAASFCCLLVRVGGLFAVIKVCFAVRACGVYRQDVLFLARILGPLLCDVSLLVGGVRLHVTCFDVVEGRGRRIFGVLCLFSDVRLLNIVRVRGCVPRGLAVLTGRLARLNVRDCVSFSFEFVVFSCANGHVVRAGVRLFFVTRPFSSFLQCVQIVGCIGARRVYFIAGPRCFRIFVVGVSRRAVLVVSFCAGEGVDGSCARRLFAAIRYLIYLFDLYCVGGRYRCLVFFEEVGGAATVFAKCEGECFWFFVAAPVCGVDGVVRLLLVIGVRFANVFPGVVDVQGPRRVDARLVHVDSRVVCQLALDVACGACVGVSSERVIGRVIRRDLLIFDLVANVARFNAGASGVNW